ncbi:MAG TPA: NADH-quinone oxidoreductase subunit C [Candidatus Marinimicrobia bacterium]|nr:NADH-quinone oxidoreductase subunit C [Candidatus Neomarinimicrobiota bacterium]HIN19378.1 NADH-quinone oxidoreductase subunit C [Candidatus Neomarinimicrobiota bacterium]
MSEDLDKLISDAVEKALQGDMDVINNIEDRVTRSKAKAALVKAKRLAKAAIAEDEPKPEESKAVEALPAELSLTEKVSAVIAKKFPNIIESDEENSHIQMKGKNWFEIAQYLRDNPDFLFDSLQCVTGYDFGENEDLEVRYNLHSMTHNHAIEIRIKTDRNDPKVPSVEKVWRIGDWFERETYDMYGIVFEGHSNMTRILCPEDWEGWPLRKDYEVQETYHGIVVPKVKDGWE